MIRYLLDEMSDQEQADFEERYFSDDGLFEHLAAAKSELLDRYAGGHLSPGDRQSVQRRIEQSAEWRHEVELAQSLRQVLAEPEFAVAAVPPSPRRPAWLAGFAAFALRPAAAVLLVACVIGLGWLWRENHRLRSQLAALRADQAAQSQREKELEGKLAELREPQAPTPPPDVKPSASPSPPPPMAESVLAFTLTTPVRSGEESETINLPAKTARLRLNVVLNFEPQPLVCDIALRTEDGQQIARRAARANYKNDAYVIETDLPATLFKTGKYVLTVNATAGADKHAAKREYRFRAQR